MKMLKKLKKWITPKIERVSIYDPNTSHHDYFGMSKQTQALHLERTKYERCKVKCMRDDDD